MIIKAPDQYDKNKLNIFLAGSIEQGSAEEWQDEASSKIIKELTNRNFKEEEYNILNPRRPKWDPTVTQSIHNPVFYEQVKWELNALENSEIVLMYFSPGTTSPISLLELGMLCERTKNRFSKDIMLIVCCPEGFWRKGNVEVMCHEYNIPLVNNLNYAIDATISAMSIILD